MTHPLNVDPYGPRGNPRDPHDESFYGTRHPSRYEADQSTISSTQPQQRMRVLVFNAAGQSIGSGAVTAVTFDTKVFDTAGLWAATKITIPSTGRVSGAWQINGQVAWPSSAAGTKRVLQIRKNGATILATAQFAPVAQIQLQSVDVLVNDPSFGDFYELVVTQDSGGNLTLAGGQDQTFVQAVHLW